MSKRDERGEPTRLWHDAQAWIHDNHDAWGYMCRLAMHEATAERTFSMQWLIEQARKKDFVKSDGSNFNGVSNSLRPALSRIMAVQLPEAEPWMTKRRSASVDMLGH